MNSKVWHAAPGGSLSEAEVREALEQVMGERALRKVLLLPPDISRSHSWAGPIVRMLYAGFAGRGVEVDILPALGSHVPMTGEELDEMYGGVPHDRFFVHNWREDTVCLGEVPGEVCARLSEGLYCEAVPVEVNRRLLDPAYDLIVSIGQVVPHEVVGMANYNKNIFVGCGGSGMINASHYMGALYGMERMMGRDHTPVHKLFDYARERYLRQLPLLFVLTVTAAGKTGADLRCLSVGSERDAFEAAVEVSRRENITYVDRPVKKVVAYLDPGEFKRTWIANKAIYRTRMMIADGGELLIIAPGLRGCGEDPLNDKLLRKYGYVGRERIMELLRENLDLQENRSAAAHIIHASTEGRFAVTYAPGKMTREEIEGIGYGYLDLREALERYPVDRLRPGLQMHNGEEIYFVPNPAVGLWAERSRFFGEACE